MIAPVAHSARCAVILSQGLRQCDCSAVLEQFAPNRPIVVAVSGGRTYKDSETVNRVLDRVEERVGIRLLIEGECPVGDGGLDTRARLWATSRQVNHLGIPPKVKKYGWPDAGPLRNKEMSLWHPELWVLFPGDRGTDSARRIATELKIRRLEVRDG